jgi:uncharacterized membrane protein
VLGGLLLRHRPFHAAAILLIAPIPAAVLTAVVAHWFPHWADPAYAEAAFYVGVALLGARAGAPDRQPFAPVPIPATS